MRRFISLITLLSAIILSVPATPAQAAGGIYASGGGKRTVGEQFTVTVTASGATFDSLQGTISVSGPVSIVSFSAGSATWLPGKTPANGSQFVGITSATSSLTVARITLKGTKEGSGSVSVSGVKLAASGSVVGTGAGGASFTITRAPTPPGAVSVSSTSHPDENEAYEATTVALAWTKASGVSGFSYVFDQAADTTPAQKIVTTDTSATFENQAIGTHYFHIRAQNADGWGPTTHFKVTIKEPDPKIDETVAKPTITGITKAASFATNLDSGVATGITFRGTAPAGFTVTPIFTPAITLPEGKALEALTDESGNWEFTIDTLIPVGYYRVAVQGLKDKVLTPVSDTSAFEITLAQGGNITAITAADAVPPTPTPTATPQTSLGTQVLGYAKHPVAWGTLVGLILLSIAALLLRRSSRRRKTA